MRGLVKKLLSKVKYDVKAALNRTPRAVCYTDKLMLP